MAGLISRDRIKFRSSTCEDAQWLVWRVEGNGAGSAEPSFRGKFNLAVEAVGMGKGHVVCLCYLYSLSDLGLTFR